MIAMLSMFLMMADQVPPPGDVASTEDIIVKAAKPPAPEEARRFVRSISIEIDGQIARFVDPVCPKVLGLDETTARAIDARLRMVTRMADIAVDAANCRPNAYIIFAEDGRKLVADLYKSNPLMFSAVTETERARVLNDAGPVRVWRSTSLRNEDGQQVRGGFLNVKTGSVVNPQTQQVVEGSVIVFDNMAAVGKTVRQLADYSAVRLLSKTRPPEQPGEAATILALFSVAEGEAPLSMTSVDQQYLRALYKGAGNRSANVKKADIAAAVGSKPGN